MLVLLCCGSVIKWNIHPLVFLEKHFLQMDIITLQTDYVEAKPRNYITEMKHAMYTLMNLGFFMIILDNNSQHQIFSNEKKSSHLPEKVKCIIILYGLKESVVSGLIFINV